VLELARACVATTCPRAHARANEPSGIPGDRRLRASRTSSLAACASAWLAIALLCDRSCSSPTNPRRCSTSRFRRKSLTCCARLSQTRIDVDLSITHDLGVYPQAMRRVIVIVRRVVHRRTSDDRRAASSPACTDTEATAQEHTARRRRGLAETLHRFGGLPRGYRREARGVRVARLSTSREGFERPRRAGKRRQ